tara:strand:- start:278 stop:487 length:210 start_codon:yes stop_codon:yes gene_type:complete
MSQPKRAPLWRACPHCRTKPPIFVKDEDIISPEIYLCLECGITWVLSEGLWFEANVPDRKTRATEGDGK